MSGSRIITYGSRYGNARRYAEKLSEMTGIPAVSCEKAGDLSAFRTVIHFGSLYAGKVTGLRQISRSLGENTMFYLATVGISGAPDMKTAAHMNASVAKQVEGRFFDASRVLHLRGGIDYPGLSTMHRLMMRLLHFAICHLSEEKQTPQIRCVNETYNQKFEYFDAEALKPLANELNLK